MRGHPHTAMRTNHGMAGTDQHDPLNRSIREPSNLIILKSARGIKIGLEYRLRMNQFSWAIPVIVRFLQQPPPRHQARQGRSRFWWWRMARPASSASALIWKSNMPTAMKSAPLLNA